MDCYQVYTAEAAAHTVISGEDAALGFRAYMSTLCSGGTAADGDVENPGHRPKMAGP